MAYIINIVYMLFNKCIIQRNYNDKVIIIIVYTNHGKIFKAIFTIFVRICQYNFYASEEIIIECLNHYIFVCLFLRGQV